MRQSKQSAERDTAILKAVYIDQILLRDVLQTHDYPIHLYNKMLLRRGCPRYDPSKQYRIAYDGKSPVVITL